MASGGYSADSGRIGHGKEEIGKFGKIREHASFGNKYVAMVPQSGRKGKKSGKKWGLGRIPDSSE
jgi:hypothetical protein